MSATMKRLTGKHTAVVTLLLLGLAGCAGFKLPDPQPKPAPTPTPAPTPAPGDLPPDGARVCSPGDTCGCAHRPPGKPWELLPPCAPVPAGCSIDGEPGPELPGHVPELGADVNAAILASYDCSGGRCQVSVSRQAAQRAIVEQLRRQGLCAGQHAPDSDEIAVARTATSPREGYHVYAGPAGGPGTLVLSPNANRPAWAAPAGAPQPPQPPDGPPPEPPANVGACGAPIPPKFDRYNLHAHLNTNDATGLVYNRETRRWDGSLVEGYCDSQGFINRLHCPVRQEGATDREACEEIAAAGVPGGKPKWTSDGQVHPTANPYQATCSSCTWLAISNTDGSAEKCCTVAAGSGQCRPGDVPEEEDACRKRE